MLAIFGLFPFPFSLACCVLVSSAKRCGRFPSVLHHIILLALSRNTIIMPQRIAPNAGLLASARIAAATAQPTPRTKFDMPLERSTTEQYGWFVTLCGVQPPRGTREAMIKEWESLALVCALLTGIAASGMFVSGNYVHDFGEYHHANEKDPGLWLSNSVRHLLAQSTVMAFCLDTFCFLNATVMSVFFSSMASREPVSPCAVSSSW